MLETLLKIGELVGSLSKLRISKTEKNKLGKTFCKIYIGLCDVVENGRGIIKILDKGGKVTDYNTLYHLLNEQSSRLTKLRSLINAKKMSNIFKIYLPKISMLKVLVEGKGERVTFLLDNIGEHKLGHFREVALDYPIPYYYHGNFVKPTKESINRAIDTINKLEEIANSLRQ